MIGDMKLAKQLLEGESNINKIYAGETLVHAAVRSNSCEMVQLVLDYGADVNGVDNNAFTPLHLAAWDDDKAHIVRLLVQRGANVHAREKVRAMTALQIAIEQGNSNIVKELTK
jgi:ankyrin repeat protein